MPTAVRRPARFTSLLAAVALAVAACASGAADPADPAEAGPEAARQAAALTVTDAWVKAADEGMTGAFGTLANSSDVDVVIMGAASDAAERMELHETAMDASGEMVMREMEEGLVVPAGGERVLAPGGDHIMLLGITEPIEPGQEVTVTLTAEDGSTLQFTATARSFAGANEEYVPEERTDDTPATDDGATRSATGQP